MKAFDKPLSAEEERRMLIDSCKGDRNARRVLIEKNMRLVAHMVKKYAVKESDIANEDLLSIGTVGLIKAVDSFDLERNVRFATYAARCIDNEILMSFRQDKKKEKEVSLNEPIGKDKEGNEISLNDIIDSEDRDVVDFVDNYMYLEQLKCIYTNMKKILSDREMDVIVRRYGIMGYAEATQYEIADDLNISRSYVSRIEKKALGKLRELLRQERLD